MTLRDKVWDAVLDTLNDEEAFKVKDLAFDESKRHTVRRVLRRMENHGWVSRETPKSSIWCRGPKYEEQLMAQKPTPN